MYNNHEDMNMPIEKRNVVEDERTPGVKTAADAAHDPIKKAASGFDSKRVVNDERQKSKARTGASKS